MMKKKILIIIAIAIGLGVAFQPKIQAGLIGKIKKAANKIKHAFEHAGKDIKKAFEKAGKFTKEMIDKVKEAGQEAVTFVEKLGEEVWEKLQGVPECVKIPALASGYAAEKATYETAKASLRGISATVSGIGTVTQAITQAVSIVATKGVVIEKIYFNAEVAQLIKMKSPQFKVSGKAGGKPFSVNIQFDVDPKKLAQKIFKAIIKKI